MPSTTNTISIEPDEFVRSLFPDKLPEWLYQDIETATPSPGWRDTGCGCSECSRNREALERLRSGPSDPDIRPDGKSFKIGRGLDSDIAIYRDRYPHRSDRYAISGEGKSIDIPVMERKIQRWIFKEQAVNVLRKKRGKAVASNTERLRKIRYQDTIIKVTMKGKPKTVPGRYETGEPYEGYEGYTALSYTPLSRTA